MVLSPDGRVDGVSVGSFSVYHPGVCSVLYLLRLLIDCVDYELFVLHGMSEVSMADRNLNVCGRFSYETKLLLMSVMQVW